MFFFIFKSKRLDIFVIQLMKWQDKGLISGKCEFQKKKISNKMDTLCHLNTLISDW